MTANVPNQTPREQVERGADPSLANPVVTALPSHEGATVPPTEPRVEQWAVMQGMAFMGCFNEPKTAEKERVRQGACAIVPPRVVRLVELREGERIVPTENERDPEAHRTIAALRRELAEAKRERDAQYGAAYEKIIAEVHEELTKCGVPGTAANGWVWRLQQLAAERQRGVVGVVRDGTYDSSGTIGGQSYTITDFVVPVYGALPLGTRVRVVPIEEKT